MKRIRTDLDAGSVRQSLFGANIWRNANGFPGASYLCLCQYAKAWTAPQSRQQLLHHLAMHVRQPEVAALEAERQPGVIEAEQVQQRRV
jgi:hypothetical protein